MTTQSNNNRSNIINLNPYKTKQIQFTISNIDNDQKDHYDNEPFSSKIFHLDMDKEKDVKSSFIYNYNLNSKRENVLDSSNFTKKYMQLYMNYGCADTKHEAGIFQENLLSKNKPSYNRIISDLSEIPNELFQGKLFIKPPKTIEKET